jgi:hypothetical protein
MVRDGLSLLLIITVGLTWLYLLSKDEDLECFKIFHKMVEKRFEKKVKVLYVDNARSTPTWQCKVSYKIMTLYIKLYVLQKRRIYTFRR